MTRMAMVRWKRIILGRDLKRLFGIRVKATTCFGAKRWGISERTGPLFAADRQVWSEYVQPNQEYRREKERSLPINLKRALRIFVFLSCLSLSWLRAGSVTGDLRLHELESEFFGNSRLLRVWLPPGYDDPDRKETKYPVLYLNDGQNLFDSATSQFTGKEWRVDEILTRMLATREIAPLIVVGIDNAGRRDRSREYLPWEDRYLQPPCPDPKGRLYPAFLLEEVIPFIENSYRVQSGPGSRVLGGSSYGGLITLYTATALPGTFAGILVESPSIYVDQARLLRENGSFSGWPARVYLGIGTHEGKDSRAEPENEEARRDLLSLEALIRKNSPRTELKVVIEDYGFHDEDAWARRLPGALRFLFGSGD